MVNLITQSELAAYAGKERAVFPEGTILTPLARDFAAENHIDIRIGGCKPAADSEMKEKLLRDIIRSVLRNTAASGNSLSREEWMKTVVAYLERIGCSVD